MSIVKGLLIRLGLADFKSERTPIRIFVLDDDRRRHRWFKRRFEGDTIDVAETVAAAKPFLEKYSYDAIFLDHDLLPHHYESSDHDDENTGYAIARWLGENAHLQNAATVIIHTRNSDAGMRMVGSLREKGRNVEYVPFPLLDVKIQNYWKR